MTQSLQPLLVPFEGDELIAVQAQDGTIYAVFTRLCENLTLSRESQVRRINRHEVLRAGLIMLTVETPGGPQALQCLKLALVPLWLSGIHAGRVKNAATQQKLVRYQHEAADVLWQAFQGQLLAPAEPLLPDTSSIAIAHLEHIIEQSRAMQRMAEDQIAIIRRMDAAARVVRGIQAEMADVHVRLGMLEEQVHPTSFITPAEAATVSTQVKAVAERLTHRDPSRNHYQGIFAELYRRFGVSSYKLLRRDQLADVRAFLDDWHRQVGNEDSPS